jgi:hypothetical protein
MAEERSGAGIVAIVRGAIRGHVIETLLVAAAAAVFLLGVIWHDEAVVGTPAYVGETHTDRVDATFVSTMLEVRDGTWVVRERDTVSAPTLGKKRFDVLHGSDAGMLFPETRDVWIRKDVPTVGVDESLVSVGGWQVPSFSGIAPIDTAVIATGFNPLGRTFGYAPGGGRLLHVTALTTGDTEALEDVEGWRDLVAQAAARFAAGVDRERPSHERIIWWRQRQLAISSTAALAALLRVPAAAEPLATLRADLDRDFTPPNPGSAFHVKTPQQILDSALALVAPDSADATTDVVPLFLLHFPDPHETLRLLIHSHSGTPVEQPLAELARSDLELRRPWSGLRATQPLGWAVPVLLLALMGVVGSGGGDRVRWRDALAVTGALVLASAALLPARHLSTETMGLMALAWMATRLSRRGALAIPPGVAHAFALAALLLPAASLLRLPPLDVLARALALVGVARLALGPLDPHPVVSDAPRKLTRKRDLFWSSLQILAVTGAALGLTLAALNPPSWATRPPDIKWVLICSGIVLSLAAGLVAFARGGRRAPQPAPLCAMAMVAAVHVAFLVISFFPHGRLSASGDLSRVSMLAAGVVALFAALRLLVVARAHRELRPTAAAADHPG